MAKFRTRARAVDMLGRQQIAGIPTAISELFKNAHDAYADFADVDYFRQSDIFALRDDGIGMTEDEFQNRWLAIGTESKVGASVGLPPPYKPKGKKTRPMLGEKGIGRLAIAAVGPQVLILTRAIRDDVRHDVVAAFINWGIFESPGLNLDQIEIPVIPYSHGALPSREDVGALVELFRDNLRNLETIIPSTLRLRISNQLDQFDVNPQELDSFLKTVSKPTLTNGGQGTHFFIKPTADTLIADIEGDPNKAEEAATPMVQRLVGFSNTMSEEKPRISTSFRDHKPLESYVDLIEPTSFFTPKEFETADHHFRGQFDEFGQFNGLVTIYKKDPLQHTIPWTAGKGAPTKCGSFELNLAYVHGKPAESLLAAHDWTRITRKLNKIGGLYIYKNGIRVLPYGSSDYDFLELEQERSKKASTGFFSYRRMFGFVKISAHENPELSEKAGREGFRENAAYRDFRAILKHFFAQMVTDFFRESGIYANAYIEAKGELQRANQLRKNRESAVKEARKQFTDELDAFFESIESGVAIDETDQLVTVIENQVEGVSHKLGTPELSMELIEIEANAKAGLNRLRQRFNVTRPKGVGLAPALEREWKAYRVESARVEEEVFQPAETRLEQTITSLANRQPTSANSKNVIRVAFEESMEKAHGSIEHKRNQAIAETTVLKQKMDGSIQGSFGSIEQLIEKSKSEFRRILKGELEEGARLGEYYRLTAAVSEKISSEATTIEDLIRRVRRAIDASTDGDELIEMLEGENLALVERSEAEVELAQLGMAVSAIGHEFRHTVSSIRNNLNRLKGWADVNRDLRELWRNIRGDFDHLDAYLELFTPLQQRLFRKKVTIKGTGVEDYVRKLFGERLKREKVELSVSNSFRRMNFDGFPSTFLPVFVNLIDNSLYWLKDRSGRKVINLDMEGGSTFVISDNGPGVPKRDSQAIFERGFTRKPGGRGMGLALAREVLQREGRELVLASSGSAEGAVFKIRVKQIERTT